MKNNKELQGYFTSFNKWYEIEIKKYVDGKRIYRPSSEEWITLRNAYTDTPIVKI